jgi:hypothetical protein
LVVGMFVRVGDVLAPSIRRRRRSVHAPGGRRRHGCLHRRNSQNSPLLRRSKAQISAAVAPNGDDGPQRIPRSPSPPLGRGLGPSAMHRRPQAKKMLLRFKVKDL